MNFEFSALCTVLIKLYVGDHNAHWLMYTYWGHIGDYTLQFTLCMYTYVLFLCLYKRRQHKCQVVGASHIKQTVPATACAVSENYNFFLRRTSFQQQWSSDETTSCSHERSVTEPAGFPYMQQACWIWLNLNSCKDRTVKFAMYRVSHEKWTPCVVLPNVHGVIFMRHPVFWHFFTTRCVREWWLFNISAVFDHLTFELCF